MPLIATITKRRGCGGEVDWVQQDTARGAQIAEIVDYVYQVYIHLRLRTTRFHHMLPVPTMGPAEIDTVRWR